MVWGFINNTIYYDVFFVVVVTCWYGISASFNYLISVSVFPCFLLDPFRFASLTSYLAAVVATTTVSCLLHLHSIQIEDT